MVEKILAACLLLIGSSVVAAQTRSPDGDWLRDDGNARVRIAPCGAQLCATNLWIGDISKGEEAGDRLIMSLDRKSDTTLVGSAYDPKRDSTYSITITVGDNGLKTRGCVLLGLLCREVRWTSANANDRK